MPYLGALLAPLPKAVPLAPAPPLRAAPTRRLTCRCPQPTLSCCAPCSVMAGPNLCRPKCGVALFTVRLAAGGTWHQLGDAAVPYAPACLHPSWPLSHGQISALAAPSLGRLSVSTSSAPDSLNPALCALQGALTCGDACDGFSCEGGTTCKVVRCPLPSRACAAKEPSAYGLTLNTLVLLEVGPISHAAHQTAGKTILSSPCPPF